MSDGVNPPSSPDIDLTKLPRLNTSIWADINKVEFKLKHPNSKNSSSHANNKNSLSNPISSDPITPSTLIPIFTIPQTPKPSRIVPRKRTYSTPTVIQPQKNLKITAVQEHALKKCNCACLLHYEDTIDQNISSPSATAEEALWTARDKIIEAYRLTKDRKEQTTLLDFLNIFRSYTETGYKSFSISPSHMNP
ncbi:hypothetical protein K3495_g17111, partial [Podosphaera aphanis]